MQIVALKDGGQVVALTPQPFDLEVDLQDLLRDYPRLLLAPVAAYQDRTIWTIGYEVGTDAGSIDLLCIDSTGEIWVVETKLARNSEAKKQVVGQVLGYTSAVADWSLDKLEAVGQDFLGRPLREHLADSIGGEEADELLTRAIEKLRQGDVTALIVLDELNPVLQKLVEFVNAHASFDLLALTVTLMEHEGTRLVVPTVTGATASKSVSSTGRSSETLDELMEGASTEFHELHNRLRSWAAERQYVWKPDPKTWRLETFDGRFIIRLYPRYDSIEMRLGTLIDSGATALVQDVRTRLEPIIGKAPETNPYLAAPRALASWDSFVSVLDDYADARERLDF